MNNMKLCSRKDCERVGQMLPLSDFNNAGNGKKRSNCKDCDRKRHKKSRQKNYLKNKDTPTDTFYNNTLKKCCLCKVKKPRTLENWTLCLENHDGLIGACKECLRDRSKKYGYKNVERNKNKTQEQLYDNTLKRCCLCGIEKLKIKENWTIHLEQFDGLCCSCKECARNDIKKQIKGLKCSADRRNISVELSDNELIEQMLFPCYYCMSIDNIEHYDKKDLIFGRYNGLDRIDNSKGYIKQNIIACCWRHNDRKSACTIALMEATLKLAKERGLNDQSKMGT